MPAPATTEKNSDATSVIGEQLRVLRQHKWLILAVTVVVGLVVLAWTLRQPKIYSATCSIEYDPNQMRPLGEGVEDVTAPSSTFWMNREFFETQNRIIESRQVAERVVETLSLHTDRTFFDDGDSLPDDWTGRSLEETAILLQERTSVELLRGTRIVHITVRDRVPARAARIANAIADAYIEKTVRDRMDSTVRAVDWLSEQLDSLRHDLETSERALHQFKVDHNILSVSMEDRQNLVAQDIERLSESLAEARTRRIEVGAHLARVRALVAGDQPEDRASGLTDVVPVAELRGQLVTKIAERQRFASRYGAAHPRMQELDAEVESLREQLQMEVDGVLRSAEADLREVSSIEQGLRRALEEAHDAGLELNLREIEYSSLSRESANHAKIYELVLERSTETGLTRMFQSTHVRVVDSALEPHYAVSPRLSVNAVVGVSAGVVLGIALAFLLAQLDRRIRGVRDAEELGLPILGVIPKIDMEGEEKAPALGRRRRARAGPAPSGRDRIVHSHPMSNVAEQCRIIRTNLMFMGADQPLRTLVLSSPEPQEGKTTVSTNLAIAFAQSGKRVLVVDTDLRRPRLHIALDISNKTGVSTVLAGEATLQQAIQDTGIPNLTALTCGPVPPNPSELLHLDRFARLIQAARDSYDFVLFDSPPLGVVTDAAIIAPQVDGMLLVIKANKTTRDSVRGVLRRTRAVGARLLGGVVNDLDPRTSSDAYSGYYNYYGKSYYGSDAAEPPPADDTPTGAHP